MKHLLDFKMGLWVKISCSNWASVSSFKENVTGQGFHLCNDDI